MHNGAPSDHVLLPAFGSSGNHLLAAFRVLFRGADGHGGEYRTATMLIVTDDLDGAAAAIQRRLRVDAARADPGARESGHRRERFAGTTVTSASRSLKLLRAKGIDDGGTARAHRGLYATLFDPDRAENLATFLADNPWRTDR